MMYDFDSETWVPVYSDDFEEWMKANEKKDSRLDEDELQRYLEKKIPGYLEDTYWGQEYNLDDKD